MVDFNFYAPTEVVFGKKSEDKVAEMVKKYGGTKVLLHYGGQSAIRSGLLDKVKKNLDDAGIPYVALGGVVPNPHLALVHEGIELCKKEAVDFCLAVGGGSVIDSLKGIAMGYYYEGDVWEIYATGKPIQKALPVGCVLTIPAAGSEMSSDSVVTNEDGLLKKGYGSNHLRCKFAIMNPERTYTLPAWQTACGATDIMMHTMERYFSIEDDMDVTDRIAESILISVKEAAPAALANPTDYHARAQIMWAGSLAHNDLTGCGTIGDWATHHLEHELSGMFDVSHGAGLAAVWGSWARYTRSQNMGRFARFAKNVMGVNTDGMSAEEAAEAGIQAMEAFYHSIGMPTSIHELLGKEITDEQIAEMADKASNYGRKTLGALKVLERQDMVNIYTLAK
ncbi:MAG: iron-containing alcohol dehydrogenase [Bacteroidales bacterium]|nr:iron-containing alcohol dehydrogenase [Bacteroidales bacterium]